MAKARVSATRRVTTLRRHFEPASKRIGRYPRLVRRACARSAGHNWSLDAIAPMIGEAFRGENGDGHVVSGSHRSSAAGIFFSPMPETEARFIEPMLFWHTHKLPDGPAWVHELNLTDTAPQPSVDRRFGPLRLIGTVVEPKCIARKNRSYHCDNCGDREAKAQASAKRASTQSW